MNTQTEIEQSVVVMAGTRYALVSTEPSGARLLLVTGETHGFSGTDQQGALLCPLTAENARELRKRLPWLQPAPLGLQTSAGFGDRLGLATPGHVAAVQNTGIAPIFAQQSVRENTRTGRSPQIVLDDAMWGVFASGWRLPWGADADHLKTLADCSPFVEAGYTFFTIDPGTFVDDAAEEDDPETLLQKVDKLPWTDLQSSLAQTKTTYLQPIRKNALVLHFDEHTLLKAIAKYAGAIAHVARMANQLKILHGATPFEMEVSVDETGTTTALLEHFYIASELKRLHIPFVSLAPRFVGRFEKGVGYIGDISELQHNLAGHAQIMNYFDNSYKLSLHTGSDKFSVYPLAMAATSGLVHLKTAGTSYLEALRLIATINPPLFRQILDFSRAHYETDRQTYHVSASLEQVPPAKDLSDQQLPDLLEQFDARQVLHVTFGSVLDTFGPELQVVLKTHREAYQDYIKRHFARHLAPFARVK